MQVHQNSNMPPGILEKKSFCVCSYFHFVCKAAKTSATKRSIFHTPESPLTTPATLTESYFWLTTTKQNITFIATKFKLAKL